VEGKLLTRMTGTSCIKKIKIYVFRLRKFNIYKVNSTQTLYIKILCFILCII